MFSAPAPWCSPRSALSSFVGGIPRFHLPGHLFLGEKGEGRWFTPAVSVTGIHLISRKEAFPSFISADALPEVSPCVDVAEIHFIFSLSSVTDSGNGLGGKGP